MAVAAAAAAMLALGGILVAAKVIYDVDLPGVDLHCCCCLHGSQRNSEVLGKQVHRCVR